MFFFFLIDLILFQFSHIKTLEYIPFYPFLWSLAYPIKEAFYWLLVHIQHLSLIVANVY